MFCKRVEPLGLCIVRWAYTFTSLEPKCLLCLAMKPTKLLLMQCVTSVNIITSNSLYAPLWLLTLSERRFFLPGSTAHNENICLPFLLMRDNKEDHIVHLRWWFWREKKKNAISILTPSYFYYYYYLLISQLLLMTLYHSLPFMSPVPHCTVGYDWLLSNHVYLKPTISQCFLHSFKWVGGLTVSNGQVNGTG